LLGPSHWLHEISLLKRVCHYFWRGLIPLAKNTLPIECQPTLGTYCDSYYLVHGCVHNFFFCGKSHIHWPINNVFWNIEHSPMEAPLWTSQLQNRNKCISQQPIYLFSLYTWELNLRQTLWDKIKVLLGTSREHNENMLGTHWEQGRKTKKNSLHPIQTSYFWGASVWMGLFNLIVPYWLRNGWKCLSSTAPVANHQSTKDGWLRR